MTCEPSPETTRAVDIIILRNWDRGMSYHPEELEPVVVFAKKIESSQPIFMNLAGSYYRKCPGGDVATYPECKKSGLAARIFGGTWKYKGVEGEDADGGTDWCEAGSPSQKFLDADLDVGEADQINFAMKKCTRDRLDKPPEGTVPMLAHNADWLEYISNEGEVKRIPIEREEIATSPMTRPAMTSMVYPIHSQLYLDKLLDATGGVWLLGCKSALDPEVFHEADLMQELNRTLGLWRFGCPDTAPTLLTAPAAHGTALQILVVLMIIGVLGLVGYQIYLRYEAATGSAHQATEVRQVEMTTPMNA